MSLLVFIDVAPDPVSIGVVLAVITFVIAFVVLLIAALVIYLWFRKRSLRGVEIARPDDSTTPQLNSPNQP